MAASGNQPVSAANLAAALGVSASGSIGSQPISVDNLKAVLDAMESSDSDKTPTTASFSRYVTNASSFSGIVRCTSMSSPGNHFSRVSDSGDYSLKCLVAGTYEITANASIIPESKATGKPMTVQVSLEIDGASVDAVIVSANYASSVSEPDSRSGTVTIDAYIPSGSMVRMTASMSASNQGLSNNQVTFNATVSLTRK